MNKEIRPDRKVAAENVNLEIVTYQCINCGASLEGASGQCKFCDTKYVLEPKAPMREDDGIWIKIKPSFPDRLVGGSLRDNEKEAQIEANIFDKIAKFYSEQLAVVGKEQIDAFLRLVIIAASKNGVSLRGYIEGSVLDFIKNESHAVTGNQSNILRLFPELMENNRFWSDVLTGSFDKRSGFNAGAFEKTKESLEKSMGYWVLYGGSESPSGKTTKVETKSAGTEQGWAWIMGIFGKNRTDE